MATLLDRLEDLGSRSGWCEEHLIEMARSVSLLVEVALQASEMADSLECELRHRYGEDIHPAMQRRFDRDMREVLAMRSALAPLLAQVPTSG